MAVIVRPDVLWSRSRAADVLAEAEQVNEMLPEAEKVPLSTGGISAEYAEELIAEIREGRDRR